MTAVATDWNRSAITHDIGSISDDVTAQFFRDQLDLAENPVKQKQEAEISRHGRFIFRTKAGTTEQTSIFLPVITQKQMVDDKFAKAWALRYERKYGKGGVEAYEELRAIVGHRIKFTRIDPARHMGCQYQTNNDMVADFLRMVVASGEIPGLYEDFALSAKIRSQYDDTLFENSEKGRAELAIHDTKYIKAFERMKGASVPAPDPDVSTAPTLVGIPRDPVVQSVTTDITTGETMIMNGSAQNEAMTVTAGQKTTPRRQYRRSDTSGKGKRPAANKR